MNHQKALLTQLLISDNLAKLTIEDYVTEIHRYHLAQPDEWYRFSEVQSGVYMVRSGTLKNWFSFSPGDVLKTQRQNLAHFGLAIFEDTSERYQFMEATGASAVYLNMIRRVNGFSPRCVMAFLLSRQSEYGVRFRAKLLEPNDLRIWQGYTIPQLVEMIK